MLSSAEEGQDTPFWGAAALVQTLGRRPEFLTQPLTVRAMFSLTIEILSSVEKEVKRDKLQLKLRRDF